ncbi:TonB-dependent receptor [Campylobacter sp. FMV-PI01]|uniref:TonB-dependent receptor n=1 Tax=Campylobacter portucalensis TaxID=2608384 RepID=A0A6L5WJ39_9BACT|nr:TonB-dependent receptor [Campylobacter portucalensis]MSN95853.1 TonB-dependent receptor [Campylobacter portucalensis]
MNNHKIIKLSVVCVLILGGGSAVFAKDERVSLDAVSVTSTIAGTSDIDGFKANIRNATLIKDVLRDIPGVYMGGTNGYNQKIYMRGMNDRGLNVTIDGARQKGNTFHHNADLLIDPAIIKKVDVGVGVHSVVGTSGAMGGSVAFETVDAADLLEDGKIFGAKLRSGYASNNKEFSQGATLYGTDEDGNFDLLGYFNHRGYGFGKAGNKQAIGGDGNDYNYLIKLGSKTGDSGKIEGSYEHLEYGGLYPMKAEWPGGLMTKFLDKNEEKKYKTQKDKKEAGKIEKQALASGKAIKVRSLKRSKYDRDTFSLNYKFNPDDYVDLKVNAYYTKHNLDMTKEDPNGINTGVKTYGLKLINKTNLQSSYLSNTLVYGFEYYNSASYNKNRSNNPKIGNPNAIANDKAKSLSIFLEDQIRHGNLSVVPGIRFDNYKLNTIGGKKGDMHGRTNYSYNNFSPALLLDYQTNFGLGAYASYAKLFRGPDVYEGIRINTNNAKAAFDSPLKPETGNSYETGLRYSENFNDNMGLNLSAKFFYNDYKNLIAELGSPGSAYATRANTGGANIRGFELATRFNVENLSLGASYSAQKTKYDLNQYAKTAGRDKKGQYGSTLAYSDTGDKFTFNAEYFITPIDLLVGWNTIAFTSIDKEKEAGVKIKKPGYAVHDLYATWLPSSSKFTGLEVNFGIYNIFNKAYASHSQRFTDFSAKTNDNIDYEEGRNVKLNVSYKF